MTKTINTNLDDLLLDHELDHILDTPEDELTQFMVDQNENEDALIQHFDTAFMNLSSSALPRARVVNLALDEVKGFKGKRLILEELLESAKKIGLTIDVHIEDIEMLEEEALDAYIAQLSTLVDDDGHSSDIY